METELCTSLKKEKRKRKETEKKEKENKQSYVQQCKEEQLDVIYLNGISCQNVCFINSFHIFQSQMCLLLGRPHI